MKNQLRQLFLNIVLLWSIAGIIPGVSYVDFGQLAIAAVILSLLRLVIQPIIALVWTPMTILSLGALKWVPSILTLFLFDWLAQGYSISQITIPSVQIDQFSLPELHFGILSSVLVFALIFHLAHKGVTWILK